MPVFLCGGDVKLEKRVAIVTGGGRGLGREIALAFAREGADLALAATGRPALESTAAEIRALGRRAIAVVADVTEEPAVAELVRRTLAELGGIDVLVNNAGVTGPTAPADEVSLEDWDRTLAVNLTGAFLCAKAVLPHMAARGRGKIVNIASIAGHIGYALRAPYAVSKWGMIGLTLTLAQEWGARGIQVNAISPGPVSGERIERVIRTRAEQTGRTIEETEREYLSKLAIPRFVDPAHVAATALFLASSESDSITGDVVRVSSGYGLS